MRCVTPAARDAPRDRWAGTRERYSAKVFCGECNACCRSGYEVEVDALDDQTLETEPGKGGAPALRRNADGTCMYLVNGRSSVYDHRPQACAG